MTAIIIPHPAAASRPAQGAIAKPDPAPSGGLSPNPFVGLRPFEAEDSLLFFGRQQQTSELLRRLHDTRFLAVVGSSGCGKSSLVRAGLIPALQAGFLVEDRDIWHIGKMKPGDAPLANLVLALASEPLSPVEIAAEVTAIREGGVEAILAGLRDRMANADSNLLLLIDQFEEIFRFNRTAMSNEEAADFVSIMLGLAEQREAPVYVVMTMRSDFLGDCDAYCGLPEALNRSQYLVPRLRREQRREAIEGPIRLYRQEIAPRLTNRLLNETIDTRDDLPILQHALMRTWDHWLVDKQGAIDIPHYELSGTIHRALSQDADAALEGMDERQLLLTKRLFQALTTVDAGNRGVRRPAKLAVVAARCDTEPAEIWPIVNRFRSGGRSFLVVSTENPNANPLIDISHESLIRQWKTLGTWVEEEAESVKTYRRLAESERLYRKGRAGLYRDQELQVALDWQAKECPNQAWVDDQPENFAAAMAFLGESKRVRDLEWAEEAFLRRWRRVRLVIAAFVLVLFFFNLNLDPVADFWKQSSQLFLDFGKRHQRILLLGENRVPLAFDLDNDGLETGAPSVSLNFEAEEHKIPTFWLEPDDAFLVMDRDGNGLVDNGRELFSAYTRKSNGEPAMNGFDALTDLDSNHDGSLSSADVEFAKLQLWRDLNQDGIAQSGELHSLSELGITAINTAREKQDQSIAKGDQLADLGSYTKADGGTGVLGEVTANRKIIRFSGAMAEMFRVSVHLVLFLGLTFLAKRSYRRFAFPSVFEAVSRGTVKAKLASQPKPKVKIVQKLKRYLARIIEWIAKWTSILLGVSILGTCSTAGFSEGDWDGLYYIVLGSAIAAFMVGWVFAVARLNSEVKEIREELAKNQKPEEG